MFLTCNKRRYLFFSKKRTTLCICMRGMLIVQVFLHSANDLKETRYQGTRA